MKKLITVFVINILLTSCANLSNTSTTELGKAVGTLAPVFMDSAKSQDSSNNNERKKHKKHKKHKKDKKETPTLLNDLGLNNRKNKEGSKILKQVNKEEVVNAVGVVTVAAVDTLTIIGGKLANYFTEQDKENAVSVIKNTEKTKAVAWCSNSADVSENVEEVKCSQSRKITQTPGAVTKKEDKICRSLKTEVVTESGEIKTENQNLCQAENGEWYDEQTA